MLLIDGALKGEYFLLPSFSNLMTSIIDTVEAAYCGHLGPGTSVRIIRLSRINGEAQKHTNLILKNPEI